tara:strand:+ start:303 stop:470 length:168 start_codon:yes stop_codon:yes gene_type:complete
MNKNLCQAVDCKSIYDHMCKCLVNVDGKETIQQVRFCHDHFLMQKAVDYNNEGKK